MFVFMTRTKRDLIMVTDVASLFDTTPEFNPEDMDVDSTPAEDLVTPPPRKGKSVADNLVRTERTATKRLKLDNATSLELTAFPSAALDTLKMCDLPTSNKDMKMVVNELKKEFPQYMHMYPHTVAAIHKWRRPRAALLSMAPCGPS